MLWRLLKYFAATAQQSVGVFITSSVGALGLSLTPEDSPTWSTVSAMDWQHALLVGAAGAICTVLLPNLMKIGDYLRRRGDVLESKTDLTGIDVTGKDNEWV